MKRLIFLSVAFFLSVTVFAQKDLDKLPESKRNAILIKTAKKIIDKYGPDFDRGLPPIVREGYESFVKTDYRVYNETTSDQDWKNRTKWSLKAHNGAKWYMVEYTLDAKKESLRQYSNVTAYVWIWADNGKPFTAAFLGPGGGGLDNLDENPNQEANFKIKLSKPAKTFVRDTSYYDKNGKLIKKRAFGTTYDY